MTCALSEGRLAGLPAGLSEAAARDRALLGFSHGLAGSGPQDANLVRRQARRDAGGSYWSGH
jgi:hypothetical protein